ncbi:hypothetical protein [Streptomyces sp. NPDC091268]|uniref:hypothetical protein n=1 Tax=Streptomyces sp. NPDC091268 TaxID=3365979 RepID=UPI0038175360
MPATPNRTPRRPAHLPRLLAVAAASLAVATGPATLAHAAPSATVSPGSVAPGGRVNLTITGCGTGSARVASNAFGAVTLSSGNPAAVTLSGGATVYGNAPTGTYKVTFECGGPGGQRTSVDLIVSAGAARGGLGGSVGAMSTGQIAMGGALVASGLGASVWFLRRRAGRVG